MPGLEELWGRLDRLERRLIADLSFGVPITLDEVGSARGQRVNNMRGGWAEADFTAVDTETTFTHGLGLSVPSASVPNVRWLLFGLQHDGTGAVAASTITIAYEAGTVTADSIQLKLFAEATRTIGGGNPVTATLFFIPADG